MPQLFSEAQSFIRKLIPKSREQPLPPDLNNLSNVQFFEVFKKHVASYKPNWIIRNPENYLAYAQTRLKDGLPRVRMPDKDKDLGQGKYLWTKEFISPDNFAVYIKLLQTSITKSDFLQNISEPEFQFMTYWSTLIIKCDGELPITLPTNLTKASSILLGTINEWNKGTDPAVYKYQVASGRLKFPRKLAVYEHGQVYGSDFEQLAKHAQGPNFSNLLSHIASHLPQDLETHSFAGLYYSMRKGGSKKSAQMSTWALAGKETPEASDSLEEIPVDPNLVKQEFLVALQLNDRKANAQYNTEVGQKQSLHRQWQKVVELIQNMSGLDSPLIRFRDLPQHHLEFIQRYLVTGSKVETLNGQINLTTSLENISVAFLRKTKEITVETWSRDRKELMTFLEILQQAYARDSATQQTKAVDEYVGEDVKVTPQEMSDTLHKLHLFVEQHILKQKNFPQARAAFLGRKDIVRLPNYPHFTMATSTALFILMAYLESQNPHFGWTRDLRNAAERALERLSKNGLEVLDGLGGNLDLGTESGMEKEMKSLLDFIERFSAYEPKNNSLEALKKSGQDPVFSVETDGSPPWAVPASKIHYNFNPERSFEVTFKPEQVVIAPGFIILIEPLSARKDTSPPDLRVVVDMSKITDEGILIPVSYDMFRHTEMHLYTENPSDFEVSLSESTVRKYYPSFLISESGATFLFIPKLRKLLDQPLELTVEIHRDEINEQEVNSRSILGMPDYMVGVKYMTPDTEDNRLTEQLIFRTVNHLSHKEDLFPKKELQPITRASEEFKDFLTDQGFDLEKIVEARNAVYKKESLSTSAYSSDLLAAAGEVAIYHEIMKQMNTLGFKYSTDISINRYLSSSDVRTYFVFGKHIGLDCDGLSFVANMIAHAATAESRYSWTKTEFVLAEADIDSDGKFGGVPNHAQVSLENSSEFFPTFEVTGHFAISPIASSEQLEKALEEVETLALTLDQKADNFDQLIQLFAAIILVLSTLSVAQTIIEKAKKRLQINTPQKLQAYIRERSRQLEVRKVEKMYPIFNQLTPAELAKVSEVLSVLIDPPFLLPMTNKPENKKEALKKRIAVTQQLEVLLQSFEFQPRVKPQEQIDALFKLNDLNKKTIELGSSSTYGKALRSRLDSIIGKADKGEATSFDEIPPGMIRVFMAIRVLLG